MLLVLNQHEQSLSPLYPLRIMGNIKAPSKNCKHQVLIIPDESSNEQYSSTEDNIACERGDFFNTLHVPQNNLASSTDGVSFTTSSTSSYAIGSKTSSIHREKIRFSSIYSSDDFCESGVQSDLNSSESPVLKSVDEWFDTMFGDSKQKNDCFYELFHQHYHFVKHVHKHLMLNCDHYKCHQNPKAISTCQSCQKLYKSPEIELSQRNSFKRGRCSSNDEVNFTTKEKPVFISPSITRDTENLIANSNDLTLKDSCTNIGRTKTSFPILDQIENDEQGDHNIMSNLPIKEDSKSIRSNIAIVKPCSKLQKNKNSEIDSQFASNFSQLAINEGKHPCRLYSTINPQPCHRDTLRRGCSYRRTLKLLNNHVSFQTPRSPSQFGTPVDNATSGRQVHFPPTRRSLPNNFTPGISKTSFKRLSVVNINKNIRKSFRRPRLSLTKSHLFGHFSISSGAEDPSTSLLGIAQRALSMAATFSGQQNVEVTEYRMSNLRFTTSASVSSPPADGVGNFVKGSRNTVLGHQAGGLTDSNSYQMNAHNSTTRMSNNLSGGASGLEGQTGGANSENTPLTQGLVSGTDDMMGNDIQNQQNNNGTAGSNGSITNGDPRTRTCCFCWCCCCSCSCMQVRPNIDENKRNSPSNDVQNRMNDTFSKEDCLPTYDELRKWGESFDCLMQSSYGQKIFKEFLRSEYSDENIMFWLACEDLKSTINADEVEEKAHNIYEDFISMLSPKEVSLDSRVREIIDANMMEPTPHTFDEAQLQIYTLMHRDSYPRFLNSRIYKDLVNEVVASQI